MTNTLNRFIDAQRSHYAAAIDELRAGRKYGHWIWFILPQLVGLGQSATSRHYGIGGLDEAKAYLAHPMLGPRYLAVVDMVRDWAGKRAPEALLGSLDALKARSSLTLFEAAGGPASIARCIDIQFGGERDPLTLDLLGQNPPT